MEQTDNMEKKTFFLTEQVKKSKITINKKKDILLKERLRTLIKSKGLSEADFYHKIGLEKQYWYSISWGLLEIPLDVKVKIAKALDSDTSVIWKENK